MMGGLYVDIHWGWLFINHLWVVEFLLGQDNDTKLVEQIEQETAPRGCRRANLYTYDIQAMDFYQKLGYEVFGALETSGAMYATLLTEANVSTPCYLVYLEAISHQLAEPRCRSLGEGPEWLV